MYAFLTALSYAGLVLLLGGAFARRWLTPGQPGAWAGAAGLGLLGLAWGGQLIVTLGALGMTGPADMLAYGTATATGRAMLTGLLGAAGLLAAERTAQSPDARSLDARSLTVRPLGTWSLWLSVLAAGVLLWGVAGVGHGDGHGAWVRLQHALHAGAMSVWVGGVLALATSRRPQVPALARRFTPAALASVAVLSVTGLLMATTHLPVLDGWWSSRYGQTLLLKLALVALALLASVFVRRAFAQRWPARPHLAREALVLVTVLGVTGALSNLAPPSGHLDHRVAEGARAAGHATAGHGGPLPTLEGVMACPGAQRLWLTLDGVTEARADQARAVRPALRHLLQVVLPQSGIRLQQPTSCTAPAGRTPLSMDGRSLNSQFPVGFGNGGPTPLVPLWVVPLAAPGANTPTTEPQP